MATIHVNRGGTSLGTFSEDEVREGLRSGKFAGSDLGWREGMAAWQPLSQFSEFAAEIPAGAPPPPSTPTPPPTVTTAPPIGSTSTPVAGVRPGLPWDRRDSTGFVNAFIGTMKTVLTEPSAAFSAMKREGGFGDPLIYTLIGGSIGLLFYFVYSFFFSSLGSLGSRENPLAHLIGTGIGSILMIICIPLFVVIGTFLASAILHLCLMIVGGAKQPFETTFRVVCFSGGSVGPIMIVPLCGALIAGIWRLVLFCIGLSRAHETETGRAVLAVLLPLIVCCGGGFFIAMMFGMLGAWGLSQH
jgi:hypothetical protein